MLRTLVMFVLVACGSSPPPGEHPAPASPSPVARSPAPTCFRTYDDATCFASADALCDRLSPGFRAHCRCGTPSADTVICHRDW